MLSILTLFSRNLPVFMTEHQAMHPESSICSVAVITATYNAAMHIQQCINSVESQTYPHVFHVIVDGRSDDQTIDIISSSKKERLIYISEPDDGIYSAWNKGIRLVNSDWFLFLGADDILLPNAIQILLENAQLSSSINLVTAKSILLAQNGNFVRLHGAPFTRKVLWHHMPNANCSTIYHKSLFSESCNFNEALRSAADYSFLIKKRKLIYPTYSSALVSCMRVGGISTKKPSLSLHESYKEKIVYYPAYCHPLLLICFWISFFKLALLVAASPKR